MFLWYQKTNVNSPLSFTTYLGLACALHIITFVFIGMIPNITPSPPPLIQTFSVHIPIQQALKAEKTAAPPPKPAKKKKIAPKTVSKTIKHKPEALGKVQEKVKGAPDKPKETPVTPAPEAPKKEESKPEAKPAEKKASAEDILKNLAEQQEKNEPEAEPEKEEPIDTEPKDIAETLTLSELDSFKQQIARCWTLPIKEAQNIPILLEVTAKPDGSIANVKVLDPATRPTIDVKIAVNNAIRAFDHPDCQKLSLPKERYSQWKLFRVIFQKDKGVS